jgi:hypothetical protein
MNTRITPLFVLIIAVILCAADGTLLQTSATAAPQTGLRKKGEGQTDQRLVAAHEWALGALRNERRKLRAGKSTWFEVQRLAADLRDVELQMSDSPNQRIASLARYANELRELEEDASSQVKSGTVATVNADEVRQWRIAAETELRHSKSGR